MLGRDLPPAVLRGESMRLQISAPQRGTVTLTQRVPGEAWITLDVSVSHALAVDEAFFRRDPWGRKPTEVRVRSIAQQPEAQ